MHSSALKKLLKKGVLMAMLPVQAMALGLGDIEISSTLNQPLDAKVSLLSVEPGEGKDLIVSLASSAAFLRAGIDRPLFLTKLRFKVEQNKNGEQFIRVTSRKPVIEPFLNFLVEVDWPRGRLLREYTILLDPPIIVFDRPSDEDSSIANQVDERPLVAVKVPAEAPAETSETKDVSDRFDTAPIEREELVVELEPEVEVEPEANIEPEIAVEPEEEVSESNFSSKSDTPSRFDISDDFDVSEEVSDAQIINTIPEVESEEPSAAMIDRESSVSLSEEETVAEDDRFNFSEDSFKSSRSLEDLSQLDGVDELSLSEQIDRDDVASPSEVKHSAIERQQNTVEIKKGDTLWGTSRAIKPDGVTVNQMMLSLLRYNPEAFIDGNINRLKKGVVLRIPDKETALSIDVSTALSLAKEQHALYQQYVAKVQGAVSSDVTQTQAPEMEEQDSVILEDEIAVEKDEAVIDEPVVEVTEPELKILKAESEEQEITPEESGKDDVLASGNASEQLLLAEEALISEQQNHQDLLSEMEELNEINSKMDSLIELKVNQLSDIQNLIDGDAGDVDVAVIDETIEDQPVVEEVDIVEEADVVEEPQMDSMAEEAVVEESALQGGDNAQPVPNKLPSLVPTKSPSMFDQLMTPAILGGIGVLIAAIVAGITFIRRKKKVLEEEVETTEESLAETAETPVDLQEKEELSDALSDLMEEEADDLEDFEATAMDTSEVDVFIDDVAEVGTATSPADINDDEGEEEKDDVIAEADVYLAYGLFPQAEDLLNSALEEHPDSKNYVEKLIETHFAAKDIEPFQTQATKFKAMSGVDGSKSWKQVVAMGKDLCPDYELFSKESDEGIDLSDITTAKPEAPDLELDEGENAIDLDFGADEEMSEEDELMESTLMLSPEDVQKAMVSTSEVMAMEEELDAEEAETETTQVIEPSVGSEELVSELESTSVMPPNANELENDDTMTLDVSSFESAEFDELGAAGHDIDDSTVNGKPLNFDNSTTNGDSLDDESSETEQLEDISDLEAIDGLEFNIDDVDISNPELADEEADLLNAIGEDLGSDEEASDTLEEVSDDLSLDFDEELISEIDGETEADAAVDEDDSQAFEILTSELTSGIDDETASDEALDDEEDKTEIVGALDESDSKVFESLGTDTISDIDDETVTGFALDDDTESKEAIDDIENINLDTLSAELISGIDDDTDANEALDELDIESDESLELGDLDVEEKMEDESADDEFDKTITVVPESEDIDLDLDSGASDEEIETMMELAKAYVDMGDTESAISALEEIISTGSDLQKGKAIPLLEKVKNT